MSKLRRGERITILVGVVLIILATLFPPVSWPASSLQVVAGNRGLGLPAKYISFPSGSGYEFLPSLGTTRSIDHSRLAVEWLIVAAATGLAVGLQHGWLKSDKP